MVGLARLPIHPFSGCYKEKKELPYIGIKSQKAVLARLLVTFLQVSSIGSKYFIVHFTIVASFSTVKVPSRFTVSREGNYKSNDRLHSHKLGLLCGRYGLCGFKS